MHIVLVLFPGWQLLDAAGPFDAFNMLARTVPELRLSILSTTLDPVPTRPGQPFSQSMVPTHTFSRGPPEPIDVVFVPGGLGAREANDEAVAFIKDQADKASYIMTVCTGTILLAKTGLLDGGVKATTNKAAWKTVIPHSKTAQWVYEARWVVDGKYWTSSGVSAGLDMALAWIAHKWDHNKAKGIANSMEYDWHEDSTWDPFAKLYDHSGALV